MEVFGEMFQQHRDRRTQYSVSTGLNQSFVNQRYFGEITVFPNKKWAIGTGIDCTIYSKENFGEQRTVPLWRASITRYVLKKNMKILYVEYKPFLGKIVQESLESRQFEVHWVTDGAEVLAAFEAFRPDVCVLDVMLPHRDGFSLGKEIRALDPQMPIIFLTAKSQTEDVLQGFDSGGNEYLRKPFSQEELIVCIKNLVNLTKGSLPTPIANADGIRLGRFLFRPERQQLQLDDQPPRQLSHRETQLLEMLSSKPNAIVERREVLKKVWGHDSIFNSRNLDVYVTLLREYLKDDPEVQILTLKGVGYRVVCS